MGVRSYKVKPIHIPVCLDELVDVSIDHPFRYHRKMPIAHCHAQQWKHILVAEAFPRHNFLAEPLCTDQSALSVHFREFRVMTHANNLFKVACRVHSENLDCNLATLIFAHPNISIPTLVQRLSRLVITMWDVQRTWK